MTELRHCPFCGGKLLFAGGKRVNRYYKGELTHYEHSQSDDCVLGKYGKVIELFTAEDINKWNRRVRDV